MKLRQARTGHYSGKHFWGCGRFPLCTGLRKLEVLPADVHARHRRIAALPQPHILRARFQKEMEEALTRFVA